jgi:hypothetical protein
MRRIEKLKRWNGLEDWELFDDLAWKTLKNQLKNVHQRESGSYENHLKCLLPIISVHVNA